MALLWKTKSSTTSFAPGVQLRTRRPFRLTLSLVILIVASGAIALHFLDQLHNDLCGRVPTLATSSICTPIVQAGWNLFYHLGGNGPWIRKDGLFYHDAPLPKKCSIDQAHMVSKLVGAGIIYVLTRSC